MLTKHQYRNLCLADYVFVVTMILSNKLMEILIVSILNYTTLV